jgi:hypothetical protein
MGSFRAFLVLLAAWVVGATALLRVLLGSAPAAPTDPAAATLGTDAAGNLALGSGSSLIDTVPPLISLSPVGGYYASPQAVTLAVNEPGARLYYTLDGSDPTLASMAYRGPFALTSTKTVKVLAVDPAGNISRRSEAYTIRPTAPRHSTGGAARAPTPTPAVGSGNQGG